MKLGWVELAGTISRIVVNLFMALFGNYDQREVKDTHRNYDQNKVNLQNSSRYSYFFMYLGLDCCAQCTHLSELHDTYSYFDFRFIRILLMVFSMHVL